MGTVLIWLLLTLGADANDIHGDAFHKKSTRQRCILQSKVNLIAARKVSHLLADRTDHVVMRLLVHLDAQCTVMDGQFAKDTALHEQVNVLVNSGQGDRRNTHLDGGKDLFRRGMAWHALHRFIQDLPLMGHGDPVLRAQITKCSQAVRHHCM